MKRIIFLLMIVSSWAHAVAPPVDNIAVKVFANTAIVSIYDFNFKNYMTRQKSTAKMFSAKGWMAFNQALIQSKLNAMVLSHHYSVTAVATRPPTIVSQGLKGGEYNWQVTMPVMVVYKNDDFQQVQYLDVTLNLIYKDNILVNEFLAAKGKAIPCEQNSKNIVVIPDKTQKKGGKTAKSKAKPGVTGEKKPK